MPNLHKNLLSVQKLALDNNAFIEFHPHFFLIKDQATRKTLLRGRSHNGLYPVPISSSPPDHAALSSVTARAASVHLWHYRLGHPSSSIVQSVISSNKLASTPSPLSLVCDSCQRAQIHQLSFNKSTHVTYAPLQLVHTDVWGPAVTSVGGFRYYVSFVDDFSRFTWLYLLKQKSDVQHAFSLFQTHVERLLDTKIQTVQSDLGGGRISPPFSLSQKSRYSSSYYLSSHVPVKRHCRAQT
jgi:hypothetical protein